jgi:CubicO group peptidase (beta-lactamase class C family)
VTSVSKRLYEQIPAVLKTARVPGLSVALITNGQLASEHGFGVKSAGKPDPVTTRTVFEAASLTKPLFAYLALLAVDSRLLDLDLPLVTYLDSETIEGKLIQHPLNAEGFRRDWFERISARHVLSHSSGMPHIEKGVPFPLFFEPGSKFKYSATGYYFLQLVMEQLKGEPLEIFAERELFQPLSMERSSLVWLDRLGTDVADGHDRRSRPQAIRKYQRAHAAASMYTTAGDYARFIIAILTVNGLTDSSRREMLTPQVAIEDNDCWGLGLGIERSGTDDALWQWGDYGIFHNFVIAYPDRGAAVVYLSNSNNGLGIRDEIVQTAMGPEFRTSQMLSRYTAYDSPPVLFAWTALEEGAQKALRQLPSFRNIDEPLDSGVLNELGWLLLEEERIEDAIAVYELNVDENPNVPNTYSSLASAYLRRGDPGDSERALENYRKVLETSSSDSYGDSDLLGQLRRDAEASILKLRSGEPDAK